MWGIIIAQSAIQVINDLLPQVWQIIPDNLRLEK